MSKKGKSQKGSQPSQHLAPIVEALNNKPGMSTGELASALGLSSSRAREILTSEVKRGNVERRHIEQDGTQVFAFFVPATKQAAPVAGPNDGEDEEDTEALLAAGDKVANDILSTEGADVEAPAKKKKEVRKARAKNGERSGRGNPNAKKSINPQQTLEDKKLIAKELGGKMIWAGRVWTMKMPDGDVVLTSREIASFDLQQFRKKLGG